MNCIKCGRMLLRKKDFWECPVCHIRREPTEKFDTRTETVIPAETKPASPVAGSRIEPVKTVSAESDIYVCYSDDDASRAFSVVESLEKNGYVCRFADRDGKTESDAKRFIEGCKIFLLVSSKECMYSSDEVDRALDTVIEHGLEKRIEYRVTTLKHNARFRTFFAGMPQIDAAGDDKTDLLIAAAESLLYGRTPEPSEAEPEDIPDPSEEEFEEPEMPNTVAETNIEKEIDDPEETARYCLTADGDNIAAMANEAGKKLFLSNASLAFLCFRRAAALGDDRAMSNLALCYLRGIGTEKDAAMAASLYRQAADKGNVHAMYEYANLCFDSDKKTAIKYLTDAADNNLAAAQYGLAVCYNDGNGVTPDRGLCLYWLNRAIANGSEAAVRYKERLDARDSGVTTIADCDLIPDDIDEED